MHNYFATLAAYPVVTHSTTGCVMDFGATDCARVPFQHLNT